jgi:hypothetical protein
MKILAIAAVALACATGTAAAEPDAAEKSAFAARLFAAPAAAVTAPQKPAYACFTRRYDSVHLARLPRQKVTAMRLLVSVEPGAEGEGPSHMFRMDVSLRNKSGRYESGGACGISEAELGPALTFGCGVDCDGGGIAVEIARDDAVLVKTERVRIWRPGSEEPNEDAASVGGGEDRIFRLDRAPLADCATLIEDKAARSAMLAK